MVTNDFPRILSRTGVLAVPQYFWAVIRADAHQACVMPRCLCIESAREVDVFGIDHLVFKPGPHRSARVGIDNDERTQASSSEISEPILKKCLRAIFKYLLTIFPHTCKLYRTEAGELDKCVRERQCVGPN